MTREEAIKCLKSFVEIRREYCDMQTMKNEIECLDMAIKALEQEHCTDVISRQAVLKQLKGCLTGGETEYQYVKLHIDSLPPVTPQPKTGRWIAQDIHNCHTIFKCSECNYIHSFMHLYGKPTADYTYCPNCGAKMEVEE